MQQRKCKRKDRNPRKPVDYCHDNLLITKRTGETSSGRVERGDSNELSRTPKKDKGTKSEVSAIDKLADIAKDKIQTSVYFPSGILKDLRNGLRELFGLLLDLQTFSGQTVGLQESIEAKEKEAQEMKDYEVNACRGILKNVSASATTQKTTVERIKKNCRWLYKKIGETVSSCWHSDPQKKRWQVYFPG